MHRFDGKELDHKKIKMCKKSIEPQTFLMLEINQSGNGKHDYRETEVLKTIDKKNKCGLKCYGSKLLYQDARKCYPYVEVA